MRKLVLLRAVLCSSIVALSGCGGGHAGAVPPPGLGSGGTASAAAAFTFEIPNAAAANSSGKTRTPRYLSAFVNSVKVTLTAVGGLPPGSPVSNTINVSAATNPACVVDPLNAANLVCTLSVQLPIGSDTIQVDAFDAGNATGNVISQQVTTISILQGRANGPFAFTLDATPGVLTVAPPATGVTGNAASGFTLNGTSPLVFTVGIRDGHGTTIPASPAIAGAPALLATSTNTSLATVAANSAAQTLTITPGSAQGTATIVLDGVPSAVADTTALTGAVAAGATTMTVANAAGISAAAGSRLLLDLGVAGKQEAVTVASVAGSTLTLSGGTLFAHAAAAVVTHYRDNQSFSSLTFNVSTIPTLIAVSGVDSSFLPLIDLYTINGATLTLYGQLNATAQTIGGTQFGATILGFDSKNTLYGFDDTHNAIYEYAFSSLCAACAHSPTATSPITNGVFAGNGLLAGFALAPDGTMAVANPFADKPQLVEFAPNAGAYSLGFTFPQPQAGFFDRGLAAAVLTNSSGTAFGAAALFISDNGGAEDPSSVTTFGPGAVGILSASAFGGGTARTTCDPGGARSCFTALRTSAPASGPTGTSIGNIDSQFVGLQWDAQNQALVVVDPTGDGINGEIFQYPFAGNAFGAPTLFPSGTFPSADANGAAISSAISRDGHVALAYVDAGGTTALVRIWDASRTPVAGWNPKNLGGANIANVSFLPDNSLVVADSLNFTLTIYNLDGSVKVPTTIAAGMTSLQTISVSGEGAHRRPNSRRRGGPWRH